MIKEKVISNYLEASENILTSFRYNRQPNADDVYIVTMQTRPFISALREIYFSDNKEKNNYYEVIYNIISKVTFHVCKENFGPGAFTDTWNGIVHALSITSSYVEELHFKETDRYFPFPTNDKKTTSQPLKAETKTFEDLFYNPNHAEVCLNILRELQPQVIDSSNNYIGKAKGIFPLWIKVLKTFKPKPLIKHFPDKVYKDLLNKQIKGLNLTKDASEFRKQYKRLEKNNTELDIKTILSQYSQNGKLGK